MLASQSQEPKEKDESKLSQKQLRVVACITGMPGAGKSTVSEVTEELGYEVFRMGDDVRMEALRRKIPPTDENLGHIMLELRQKGGFAAIAALCKERIQRESNSSFVVIDGVRSMNEFFEFKKLGNTILVTVHASPRSRYKFLQIRQRSDLPASWDSFEARDKRELSVGIGESIAMADEIIINSGSIEELKQEARRLFRRLKGTDKNPSI